MTMTHEPATRRSGAAEPALKLSVAKQSLAAARARGLIELMGRRPELLGVYRPADVAAEAIRWSA